MKMETCVSGDYFSFYMLMRSRLICTVLKNAKRNGTFCIAA